MHHNINNGDRLILADFIRGDFLFSNYPGLLHPEIQSDIGLHRNFIRSDILHK